MTDHTQCFVIHYHYFNRKILSLHPLQFLDIHLEWVKRENLPVKIMVMNNEALGMIRHLQRDYFDCLFAGTTDGCGFASCNFAEVAKAYGIPALRMLCDAVREEAPEFLEGEGPKLLEVMLEHGTFAYPKTCLGEPIHNQQPYAPKEVYDRLMEL